MSVKARMALAIAVACLLVLVALLATGGVLWADLSVDERATLAPIISPRAGLIGAMGVLVMAIAAIFARSLHQRCVAVPARLAEDSRTLLAADPTRRLTAGGSGETRIFVDTINALADQREALQVDVESRISAARHSVEEEKNRLAALMSELTQSVVVCNLDGRILLYNNRARLQVRAMSGAPGAAGGSELIGLGRSIYAVMDRNHFKGTIFE